MTRPLKTKQQVQDEARIRRQEQRATRKRVRATYKTAGGRHSDPDKLDWLRKRPCIVRENHFVVHRAIRSDGRPGGVLLSGQTPCVGRVEAHHHRERGSRATDERTIPLCGSHHRTAPDSLHVLGRDGFQRFHRLDLNAECERYEREWQESK